MRSSSRTGPARAASRHDAATGSVSPAALRMAQEADATMSPDGWEADYSAPAFVAAMPVASPVSFLAGMVPAAQDLQT